MSRYHDDFSDELAETTTGLLLMVLVFALYIFVLALPPLFRLAVALTRWLLRWLDGSLDGRLSESEALTLLAAGGFWAAVSVPGALLLVVPMAVGTGLELGLLALPLLAPGFLFGLACGYKALEEDVPTGETAGALDMSHWLDISEDRDNDLEDWFTEGVFLGEETTDDWLAD